MNKILKFSLILGIACPLTMASQEYTPGFEPTPGSDSTTGFESTPVEQVTIADTEMISTPIEETNTQIQNNQIMQMYNDLNPIYTNFMNTQLEDMDSFINSNPSICNESNNLWRFLFLEYVQNNIKEIVLQPGRYQKIYPTLGKFYYHMNFINCLDFNTQNYEDFVNAFWNSSTFIVDSNSGRTQKEIEKEISERLEAYSKFIIQVIEDAIKANFANLDRFTKVTIPSYLESAGIKSTQEKFNSLQECIKTAYNKKTSKSDELRGYLENCGFKMD